MYLYSGQNEHTCCSSPLNEHRTGYKFCLRQTLSFNPFRTECRLNGTIKASNRESEENCSRLQSSGDVVSQQTRSLSGPGGLQTLLETASSHFSAGSPHPRAVGDVAAFWRRRQRTSGKSTSGAVHTRPRNYTKTCKTDR